MRSLTSGIAGQLTLSGAFPGWLIEITASTGQVLRYTTLDVAYSYGGFSWSALDIDPPQLVWDGTILKPAQLVFGDADGAFWQIAQQQALLDAGVRIYQIYAAVSAEAEPVWSGRVGQIKRIGAASGPPTITMALSNSSDTVSSPRSRVQELVPAKLLLAAGTVLTIGNQQVTIQRSNTGAG